MRRWLWLVVFWFAALTGVSGLQAQSSAMPAAPTRYVSDRAFVLDEPTIGSLNAKLESFEKETSNQVVVAIFANLPAGAEIAQYSTQVFRFWGVGQKGKDNGVVLFVYKNDRKLFIATGRGLEGALPDFTCKQIIASEIVPQFKAGNFAGGITAGVEAILAATKGEYHGTGRTANDHVASSVAKGAGFLPILFFALFIYVMIQNVRRGAPDRVLNRRGYYNYGSPNVLGQDSWSSSGGSSGGGWSGGGGGGGFSGGGGSSGGGGAGGSW